MVVNAVFVIGERRVRQSDIGICRDASIHPSRAPVDLTIAATPRAVRRWVSGELAVPRHIALLVNLMLDTGTKPEELQP